MAPQTRVQNKKKVSAREKAKKEAEIKKKDLQKKIAATKDRFIEAFKKKAGNISSACAAVNVSRQTFYTWLKDDAQFQVKVDEVNEYLLDYTESKLMERITEGDTTCIIFHLKTKGKSRGYTERSEIQHSGEIIVGLPEEMME